MQVEVRRARPDDQAAITAMVRRARLNPAGLDWGGFVVAEGDGRVIGVLQLRRHPDGAVEMASLVVEPEGRGQGVATRMTGALLAKETGPVYAVLDRRFVHHYEQWGFARIGVDELPRSIARTYRIGRVATVIGSVIRRKRIRLVAIHRPAR